MSAHDAAIDLVALGVTLSPMAGFGYWMYRGWSRDRIQQRDRELYRLIRYNKGQVTLTQYVIESALAPKEARAHLEQRAKELGARCEVTDTGQIVYFFEI